VKLAFLGAPGSGKGTYASRLAPTLEIPHISSGDILRNALANKTPLGLEAQKYMNEGVKTPDHIVMGLVTERLTQPDCEKGFIFDCPYDDGQAKAVDTDERTKIDLALNVEIPEEVVIRRLSSRRICKACGAIYNVLTLPPKVEDVCDKCNGELYQREDDKEEAVKTRLEVYKNRAGPMIEYYKQTGKLRNVEWKKEDVPEGMIDVPVQTMLDKILSILKTEGLRE